MILNLFPFSKGSPGIKVKRPEASEDPTGRIGMTQDDGAQNLGSYERVTAKELYI